MADKDFRVKNRLHVNGLTNTSGVILATNNALDSHTNVPTQYGGTGTTQSPAAGQVLFSSAGTTYTPTTLTSLDVKGATYSADAPANPVVGQVWIESDSSSDSFDPNIIRRKTITATAGQTTFTTDLEFIQGYEQVYFNGMLLLRTSDYTTPSNTSVVLAAAAAAGDIVEILSITNLNSINTATTTTNTFTGSQYITGSSSKLGIGNSNPSKKLVISDQVDNTYTSLIRLANTGSGSNGTAIEFAGTYNASGLDFAYNAGRVGGLVTNGIAGNGHLIFEVNSSGTLTERLRLTESGNISTGRLTVTGSVGDGDYIIRAVPPGGSSGQRSNIAFYGTFANFPQDTGPRRVADIIAGYSTSVWGTEYLSFNVGSAGDVQNVTSEKMRINASGTVAVGWTGDNNWGLSVSTSTAGAGAFLATQNATNIASGLFEATNNSYVDVLLKLKATRANTSAYSFIQALSSGAGDAEFNLRGDGQAYADGSWNSGGADYAEYFEWSDGNQNNENRKGYSVSLVGNKIKISEEGETPIGVVSANPSIVGDAGWNSWSNKYLLDEFNDYIRDENGDRILNPEYDPEQEYISRENRPEWAIVGLMGKLRLRKGQVTGAGWIKMRDISEIVEEWLVK